MERRAVELINAGRHDEAEALYRELIASGGASERSYGNLAVLCMMQGRNAEAGGLLDQALTLNPDFADAHNNRGIVLREQGDLQAAIASYRRALARKPDFPDAHNNLGIALRETGDLEGSLQCYQQALSIKPDHSDALYNLGLSLHDLDRIDEAIDAYGQALRSKPVYPQAHLNLGNALLARGDHDGAIESYGKALEQRPDYPDALWNLSHAQLLSGDYAAGWPNYEWRDHPSRRDPTVTHARPTCPRWQGEPLVRGQRLLLVSEQGLGDTLQFVRYALPLRDQGMEVSLCAQPRLHGLLRASGLADTPLTPEQAAAVSEGLWTPLLSVPRHLGVTPAAPILTTPYLRTEETLIQRWRERLAGERRPLIAINWQGNPDQEKGIARGRSLPLEVLAPLAAACGGTLVSLQKGVGSEQLRHCSFRDRFASCQPSIDSCWDFLETAAILAVCDLVISSDTALAHLAGGMGRPTWLLLKQVPDWRWGLEGETSFWYPSMRLFRQRQAGDWPEVIERVARALRLWSEADGSDNHGDRAEAPSPGGDAQAHPPQSPAASPGGQRLLAPVSLGELIDKITILRIKADHLSGQALAHVQAELSALEATLEALDLAVDPGLIRRLEEVNRDLWQIEDDIRDQERQQDFGETFIRLARWVYQQNDRRAAIKREINLSYGSALVEEKSYSAY